MLYYLVVYCIVLPNILSKSSLSKVRILHVHNNNYLPVTGCFIQSQCSLPANQLFSYGMVICPDCDNTTANATARLGYRHNLQQPQAIEDAASKDALKTFLTDIYCQPPAKL